MIAAFLLGFGIQVVLIVLQTNLLQFVALAGAVPDLALVVLVYLANRNGQMLGQTLGFASGLVLDFLSLAPLGFHTFLRTLLGAAYGRTKGNIFVDPILVPMVLVVVGTVAEGLVGAAVSAIFGLESIVGRLVSVGFLVEVGMNAFFAPFLFGLLKVIRPLVPQVRDGSA